MNSLKCIISLEFCEYQQVGDVTLTVDDRINSNKINATLNKFKEIIPFVHQENSFICMKAENVSKGTFLHLVGTLGEMEWILISSQIYLKDHHTIREFYFQKSFNDDSKENIADVIDVNISKKNEPGSLTNNEKKSHTQPNQPTSMNNEEIEKNQNVTSIQNPNPIESLTSSSESLSASSIIASIQKDIILSADRSPSFNKLTGTRSCFSISGAGRDKNLLKNGSEDSGNPLPNRFVSSVSVTGSSPVTKLDCLKSPLSVALQSTTITTSPSRETVSIGATTATSINTEIAVTTTSPVIKEAAVTTTSPVTKEATIETTSLVTKEAAVTKTSPVTKEAAIETTTTSPVIKAPIYLKSNSRTLLASKLVPIITPIVIIDEANSTESIITDESNKLMTPTKLVEFVPDYNTMSNTTETVPISNNLSVEVKNISVVAKVLPPPPPPPPPPPVTLPPSMTTTNAFRFLPTKDSHNSERSINKNHPLALAVDDNRPKSDSEMPSTPEKISVKSMASNLAAFQIQRGMSIGMPMPRPSFKSPPPPSLQQRPDPPPRPVTGDSVESENNSSMGTLLSTPALTRVTVIGAGSMQQRRAGTRRNPKITLPLETEMLVPMEITPKMTEILTPTTPLKNNGTQDSSQKVSNELTVSSPADNSNTTTNSNTNVKTSVERKTPKHLPPPPPPPATTVTVTSPLTNDTVQQRTRLNMRTPVAVLPPPPPPPVLPSPPPLPSSLLSMPLPPSSPVPVSVGLTTSSSFSSDQGQDNDLVEGEEVQEGVECDPLKEGSTSSVKERIKSVVVSRWDGRDDSNYDDDDDNSSDVSNNDVVGGGSGCNRRAPIPSVDIISAFHVHIEPSNPGYFRSPLYHKTHLNNNNNSSSNNTVNTDKLHVINEGESTSSSSTCISDNNSNILEDEDFSSRSKPILDQNNISFSHQSFLSGTASSTVTATPGMTDAEYFDMLRKNEEEEKIRKAERELKLDPEALRRLKEAEQATRQHETEKTSFYMKFSRNYFTAHKQNNTNGRTGRGGRSGRGAGGREEES